MAACLFLLLLLSFRLAASDPAESERSALLSFLSQTPHKSRLRWPSSTPTCSWTGVRCDPSNSTVIALRLPGVGLVGPIPPRTLSLLPNLRILSLHSNRLSGTVPSDFSNLSSLHSLYLQENQLAGPFPAAIPSLTQLTRLDLSGNDLSGQIPFAVNNLTKLTRLFLQSNRFDGPIPSISLPNLEAFNVSFNSLNGSIPQTLDGFPASSFAGNLALCGPPLSPCSPFFPPSPAPAAVASPPSRRKHKHKLSTAAIIAIAVAGGGILIILLLLLLICCVFKSRRRSSKSPAKPPPVAAGAAPRSGDTGLTSSSKDELSGGVSGEGGEKNRLVFVGQGGGYSFDLEDLLRASAEVLGKGSVGTSYKAVLEEGTTVVVKRLKDVVVSKREFEQHMEGIGRVAEHGNVLPLRAYYYSKDEKLLVFDFLAAGSLSSLLHGSRGSGRTPLDWDNRMRVALAAGRGLAHLHTSAHLVHGNVKASNVLLRPDLSASALSDFGLTPLFGSSAAPNRVAGYRAPEVLETRRPTLKSDVYSFGVLLLELLTGKAPNQASIGDEGIDLPRWVQSVVREEWTAEVFDVELMRYANIEEEMVQLLQIAMACVATVPDSRPEIGEVVRMMEEIRAEGGDEGLRASSDDPSKTGSGGPTPPAGATP